MNILDVITNAQDGAAVQQLGSQFGLAPAQTQSALAALVPALAAGLQQNAASEDGLSSLVSALTAGGHQRYLEDPATLANATATQDGNGILGHILGSRDASRAVAQQASQQTGLPVDTLKQMLPLIAAMTMGGLSRQSGSSGAGLAGLTGDSSGLMSLLTPMLDSNRDGSVVDDVIGIAKRFIAGGGSR
jgi:hypothetical protein